MTERKRKLLIILGVILAITPFLGIPPSWKTFIYVALGLWITITTFLINKNFSFLKRENEKAEKPASDEDSFVQIDQNEQTEEKNNG